MKLSERLTITAPVVFIEQIKAKAKADDIPLSCMIRHALKKYMDGSYE
jgi:predicted DNA binding CopG/RHH family protein